MANSQEFQSCNRSSILRSDTKENFKNFLNCSLCGQNAPEELIAFGENESSNLSGLGIKWVSNSTGRVGIL